MVQDAICLRRSLFVGRTWKTWTSWSRCEWNSVSAALKWFCIDTCMTHDASCVSLLRALDQMDHQWVFIHISCHSIFQHQTRVDMLTNSMFNTRDHQGLGGFQAKWGKLDRLWVLLFEFTVKDLWSTPILWTLMEVRGWFKTRKSIRNLKHSN